MEIQQIQNPKYQRTAKIAGVSAAIMGGLSALGNYGVQKAILSSPDVYIKSLETQKAQLKDIFKDEAQLARQTKFADQVIADTKELIKSGKVQVGKIAKGALASAGKAAVVFGGIYFIGKTIKDFIFTEKAPKKAADKTQAQ